MGIPVLPGPTIPGAGCSTCFADNMTPQYAYVTLSGLTKTPGTYPFLPDTADGMFRLEWVSACHWSASFGIFTIDYWAAGLGPATLSLGIYPMAWGQAGVGANCATGFAMNQYVGPHVYAAGCGSVTF